MQKDSRVMHVMHELHAIVDTVRTLLVPIPCKECVGGVRFDLVLFFFGRFLANNFAVFIFAPQCASTNQFASDKRIVVVAIRAAQIRASSLCARSCLHSQSLSAC